MRVTAHIPDAIAKNIKDLAENEGKSVSALIAESLQSYMAEKKRKSLGMKVLNLAGKTAVAPDTLQDLERSREDSHDRS